MTTKNIKKLAIYMACVIIGFLLIGPVTWNYLAKPNSPYVILDTEAQAPQNWQHWPYDYMPVEMTGKAPEQGQTEVVGCKIADGMIQYIHYPDTWTQYNPLNPQGIVGIVVKYTLYAILVISVGLLIWAVIRKRKVIAIKIERLEDKWK